MENSATRKVQIHTFIPVEIREQLRTLALQNDRTLAAEMRRAVYQHVREKGSTRSAAV
jgi:hypothetical protein